MCGKLQRLLCGVLEIQNLRHPRDLAILGREYNYGGGVGGKSVWSKDKGVNGLK